jgi:hypothetical protein
MGRALLQAAGNNHDNHHNHNDHNTDSPVNDNRASVDDHHNNVVDDFLEHFIVDTLTSITIRANIGLDTTDPTVMSHVARYLHKPHSTL